MCHGYYNFFIILRLNIYAQTHTEKGVSITKISAYKLDKHAVNIIFGLKLTSNSWQLHRISLLKSFVLLDKNIERSKENIKEEFWKERKKRNIVSLLVKASSVAN